MNKLIHVSIYPFHLFLFKGYVFHFLNQNQSNSIWKLSSERLIFAISPWFYFFFIIFSSPLSANRAVVIDSWSLCAGSCSECLETRIWSNDKLNLLELLATAFGLGFFLPNCGVSEARVRCPYSDLLVVFCAGLDWAADEYNSRVLGDIIILFWDLKWLWGDDIRYFSILGSFSWEGKMLIFVFTFYGCDYKGAIWDFLMMVWAQFSYSFRRFLSELISNF